MSDVNVLPTELSALIEHIELHKSGWWDTGIRRCVVGAIWQQQSPVQREHIPDLLVPFVGDGLHRDKVDAAVSHLLGEGVLINLQDERVKLSEQTSEQLSSAYHTVAQNEVAAFEVFVAVLDGLPIAEDVDHCWASFQIDLLLPVISEFGARTYELLVGDGPSDVMDTDRVDRLVRSLCPDAPEKLRDAFANFLDPTNPVIRSFVLRRLTASFFVHAAGLSSETLDLLDSSRAVGRQLIVFVDTNYLFSILGLHDNPSNDSAQALLNLVKRVSQRIDVRLRVLPITIDETRRVVRAHSFFLDGISLPSNLARAGFDDVSQITRRYLEAASQSSTRLSASDFFRDYDEDLLTVLRDRGLDVYNENLDPYRTRQDVIDSIHEVEAQQERTPRGAKRYEANLHDMVVWHVTADKRPAAADSPLDLRFWIVTVDFGLMRYDKFKLRSSRSARFASCLHPAELMQLLQFWIPRDEAFESALIGAIRHPFVSSDFDSATEKVTVQILRRLSRYESIDDLSPDAVARILENEAVRSVFASSQDEAEHDGVIHDAMVAELDRLDALAREQAEALELAEHTISDTQERVLATRQEAENELRAVEGERESLLVQIRELEGQATSAAERADSAERSAEDLRSRVADLEKSEAERMRSSRQRDLRRKAIVIILAISVASILLAMVLGPAFSSALPLSSALTWVLLVTALISGWLLVSDWWLARHPETRDWAVWRAVHSLRRWAVGLISGVGVSFFGAWLFELFTRS